MQPTKLYLAVGLSIALVALSGRPAAWAGEEPPDPDEQFLEDSGIGTDAASLLEFLRRRSSTDVDPENLEPLIRQLGSSSFEKREQASKKLLMLGLHALKPLRRAVNDPDKEIAKRAKECLYKIERYQGWGLPSTAVRRLVRLGPRGTVEVLLRYLPYAVDQETAEEIWYGLDALASADGKLEQALVEAVKETAPARRAVAACIVGRLGNAQQRAAVRKLLTDADPGVCLRAAQGLLAAKDPSAIPTLIALLEEPSIEVSWQAEELLHWFALKDTVGLTVGSGTPERRERCRKAWQEWWRRQAGKLNWDASDKTDRRPGLFLVCDRGADAPGGAGRVWLCGCDGQPRWQLDRLRGPSDVHLLRDNRLLLAEAAAGRVTERDLQGNILWKEDCPNSSFIACRRLPSGNTLIVDNGKRGLREITAVGEETYQHALTVDHSPLEGAQILGNGRIFGFCRHPGKEEDHWLLAEFEADTGRELKRWRVSERARPYGHFHRLADGHVLAVQTGTLVDFYEGENATVYCRPVRETERSGEIFELDSQRATTGKRTLLEMYPNHAIRRRNGNVLMACLVENSIGGLVEIDAKGKTVWEAIAGETPVVVRPCLGLVGVGFGRGPAISDVDSVAHRIEQLKDPNWHVRRWAVRALQRLGPDAEPAIPALIDAFDDPAVESAIGQTLISIGPKAIPALGGALRHRRTAVRSAAATYLGAFGDCSETVKVLGDLLKALKDDEWTVRRNGVGALGAFASKAEKVLPALIEALKDKNADVRVAAAYALGKLGPRARLAVMPLADAIQAKDDTLRIFAVGALGEIGPEAKPAVPALIKGLRDTHYRSCHRAIAFALADIGPEATAAVAVLVEALKGNDAELHEAAAFALGRIGPAAKAAVPALIATLQDKDARLEAIEAIGRVGPAARQAVPALIVALQDRDLRIDAAEALGRIGAHARAAIPALKDALRASDSRFRLAAQRAIENIKGK